MTDPTESPTNASYFDQVPNWPTFAVLSDDTSGRVPVTKIKGWREIPSLLEDAFFNRPKIQLIYRGHRRFDWPLTPSLGRVDPRRIITQDTAEAQIRLFRRAVRGRLDDHSLVEEGEENELWSVGQHHGLLTPLLDWTYSPYVGLFFAFEKEDPRNGELDNPYRAIYVLNKSHVEADDRCPEVSILEPRKDDHGRLVNQAGLFTYSAYGNTLENSLTNSLKDEVLGGVPEEEEANELAKYLCKIYIPNEDREGCLRHLRMMNVHHASLFPDLIGAAEYCNILVAEESVYYRQTEIERQEKQTPAESPVPSVAPVLPSAEREEQSLLALLQGPVESAEVEPARLQLIAQELASELAKSRLVDWDKRETVQAAMRTSARVVLRKLGYPPGAREAVLDALLGTIKGESREPSDGE